MRTRRGIQAALVACTLLAATGCLSGGGGGGSSSGGGNNSKTVEIVFGFGGDQSKGFRESLKQFQKDSGITIKFTEASQSFDTLIRTRVQANNLPDIALFPQPGILKDFVKQGKMTPLSTQLDVNQLQQNLVSGVLDAGKGADGQFYGVPISMNVKSLVFYPKQAWQAKGYTIPKTLDELQALTNKIKASGTPPWCLGIESSAATGWPATDWIEDLVLRYGGPQTYDKWVDHQIPFDDPVVKQAAQEFERLALTNGNVLGGRRGAVSTAFATAGNPMFNNPPKCWMLKQGNFITQKGFFPDKVVANIDQTAGVFYFPGKTPDDRPVLGGGDLAAVFKGKSSNTKKVLQFLTSNDYKGWSEKAGFMSPNKHYNLSNYQTQIQRQMAQIGLNASVYRFDGSDQMPGAVGSGSFWKGMVAWISGQQNLDTTLKNIDQSWPS